MNGLLADIDRIVDHLNASELDPNVDVCISPPAIYLLHVRDRVKKGILVAAQNCYSEKQGAFTGEIRCVCLLLTFSTRGTDACTWYEIARYRSPTRASAG
jgi:triosephosphate isomerase